ncbi:protein-tyrosine phosphatase [Weissella uvarum]|uniref:tyrosine-protein phosphatase n=1 Tax=Weissella uvarum TaxID=1479233 RepID=UPI0019611C23|nr:CpsB/CapC family capsule biosynthesis tyrosine phosphatase [Weissella uvarum]MBM7617697.1 protein-tyrosine phosphatase [Weissella uvarum]MCM0596046.1 tyrosine protein phosphatase [Weissella uvarum]
MIDIHCHLLPNLDDGSPSLEQSLDLAREAVANQVTHALVTPHHMNGRYVNHAKDVMAETAAFQEALEDANIPLTVFPGQEIRMNGDLLQAYDAHDLLATDEFNTYMLIEFPSDEVPVFSEQVLFELQQRGTTPIIVHPERNQGFMDHPDKLVDFISRGMLAQVTASSYVGTFGSKVAAFAQDIVSHGLAHFFASDAHVMKRRSYQLQVAYQQLEKADAQMAHAFEENAKAAVNGDPVTTFAVTPIKKRRFFAKY